MRRTRLVFAPQDPEAAPSYLLLDEEGGVVGRGEQPVQAEAPAGTATVVLVVPGVDATARWLRLPARADAQARAAAALLLEDERALGEEPLHLSVGPLEPDGCRLVVAVGEARMRAWLGLARLHGLSPDVVIPEHLLLPEPEGDRPVTVRFGATVSVRARRLAFACEPELAPILLEDRIPELVEAPEAVERLLAAGAEAPVVNLLQGVFAVAHPSRVQPREWLRPALLAAALLLSPIALNAAQALRLNLAADGVEREVERQAAATLPKGTALNDPRAQVEARRQRLGLVAGGGPAGLSARLFHAIADLDGAQVESLLVSPDGALRAAISHTNYSDMELLADAMRRGGGAFREEGSREEGGRIVSDVILGVRP